MGHFYGFTPEIIGNMTYRQVSAWYKQVPEIFKMLSPYGGKSSRKEQGDPQLVKRLQKLGLRVPKGLK